MSHKRFQGEAFVPGLFSEENLKERMKDFRSSALFACPATTRQTDRHSQNLPTPQNMWIFAHDPQNPKPLRIPYLLDPPDSNEHRNNQPLTLLFFFCFTNFKEMAKEKTKPNRLRVSSRTLLLTMTDSMQQMLYQAGPWNRLFCSRKHDSENLNDILLPRKKKDYIQTVSL